MTAATADQATGQRGFGSSLIHRQLDSYPETGARVFYLSLVVLATIMLYYELYVGGSVSTLILTNLGMTFKFYVLTLAIGNLLGAFGSLFAGLTDRYGRANLVVFGLLFAAVFVAFVLPTATNRYVFTLESFIVGIVEGICLVATPALIRDFSPQVGRATAMGAWTTGPVLGSLVVAIVGANTIPAVIHSTRFWTHEYRICGYVGLIVFVVAFFWLRELSPQLRDQLMVSLRDRALVEAKAKGLDVEALLKNHWRQLIKADVIISAFAVSVMLLVYYALVGLLIIIAQALFSYSLPESNDLGYWAWSFDAAAVVLIGVLSDRLRVRKPFMLIGGIGSAVLIWLFLEQFKVHAHPSYATIAALLAVMLFFLGVAYSPWMASFTETVEDKNPAAIAAGLAIWGWIIRVVVFLSFLFIPFVINTVTPIVDYGTAIGTDLANYPVLTWAHAHPAIVADAQKYSAQLTFAKDHSDIVALAQRYGALAVKAQQLAPEIAFIQKNPALIAQLSHYTAKNIPPKLLNKAIAAAGGGLKGIGILTTMSANQSTLKAIKAAAPALQKMAPYAAQLTALAAVPHSVIVAVTPFAAQLGALAKVPPGVISYVSTFAPQVQAAQLKAPGQFRTWFWVCFGGVIFFLLSIPVLRGRWSPRAAKRDYDEHEAMVQTEMAKLGLTTADA
jgi:MFS family permease